MKHNYIILLYVIVLVTACSSNNQDAITYLESARKDFTNKDYETALSKIDSIPILYPKAFNQIAMGQYLTDSVKQELNQAKMDSLNLQINDYSRQITLLRQKGNETKKIAELEEKIDSLAKLKAMPKAILDDICTRELQRMSSCQCRTAMQQRD